MVTYDFAFCTKFRYDVLKPKMLAKTGQLLDDVAASFNGNVLGNARVDEDFIHVRVRCPEDVAIKDLLFALKGKLSVWLQEEYPELVTVFNKKPMFDRSFFRTNSAASTEELDAWKNQHPKHTTPAH